VGDNEQDSPSPEDNHATSGDDRRTLAARLGLTERGGPGSGYGEPHYGRPGEQGGSRKREAGQSEIEAHLRPYRIDNVRDLWGAASTFYVAPNGSIYSAGTHAETASAASIPKESWPVDKKGGRVGLEYALVAKA